MYKLSQVNPDGSIMLHGNKIADTILYVNGEYVKKSELQALLNEMLGGSNESTISGTKSDK